MAYDPETDIDEGDDIEGHAQAQDRQDALEQQPPAALPQALPPALRRAAPGVYSPEQEQEQTPAPAPAQPNAALERLRARQAPVLAGFKVSDDEAYTFGAPAGAPAKDTGSLTWKDYGDSALSSVLSAGASFAGAADWAQKKLAGDPELKTYFEGARDWATRHAEATIDGMSARGKEVVRAKLFGDDTRDANGNQIPSAWDVGLPGYAAMHIVDMIPDGIMMLAPAGIAARAAVWAARGLGVAVKAIEAGETVATLTRAGRAIQAAGSATGMGGYFGTEALGEFYNKLVTDTGNAKDGDLKAGSEFYRHLRETGVDETAAKKQLIGSYAPFVAAAGLAGFVGGAGMGALGGGVARGAIAGALSMGGQGAATTTLQQTVEQRQGTRQGYDLGSIMADAAAQGFGGGLLGGFGGLFHGRAPKPGVDDAAGAALHASDIYATPAGPPEALPQARQVYTEPPGPPAPPQGQLDLSAAPPGPPVRSPQGEMFPTTQEANAPTNVVGPEGTPAVTGMTEQAAPTPPPGPVSSRAGGMPGAVQEGLPINQTPPVIVPTTGQGEMFPSLPEANPAVREGVPMTEEQPPPGEQPPPTTPPAGGGGTPEAAASAESMAMGKKALVEDIATRPGAPPIQKLRPMKKEDLAKLRDRLNATQPDTTVVTGADRDRTTAPSERPAQTSAEETAPPVSGEALTPPAAPEGGAPEIPPTPVKAELTGQEPAPEVRPGGGPSPDTMAKSGEGIAPTPTPAAAEAAIKVSASRRKPAKQVLEIPRRTSEAYVEAPTTGTRAEMTRTTEVTPEVEQARADRVGDLAEAVRVIPAPKGTALDAAIRRAQREMGEAIGKTDGSKDAAAETIDHWVGLQTTAPYPGSKITPRMLAEHLMQRVAGRQLAEREGARAEITEARREDTGRRAGEAKVAPGEVEGIAETRSEGAEGTTALTPEVKPKRLDTTDHRRTADNLIQRVLNREITPAEADAEYGKPQAGAGAKRRWPRLADRLKDWIAHAEDPKVERDLLEKLATTQNDKDLTPHEKSTQTKQLTRQLERTGPEFASELREHLQAMEDPVADVVNKRAELRAKMAARKGEPPPEAPLDAPLPAGINPRSSRYVTGSADPRLGANYVAAFGDRIRGEGAPVMAREAAQMIAQDPMVRAEQGPLREVAERFAKLVPHDVPIMSLQRALGEGRITKALHDELYSRNVYGAYDPESRTILHNLDANRLTGSHIETALHEMSHAISWHYLRMLETSNKFHPDLRALHAIRGELARHVMEEGRAGRLTDQERQRLMKAIGNNHELHTQLFTDPVVQGFASSRVASPALLDTLRSLGHPGVPGQSVWRSFANWVRKAIGQPPARSASEFTLFDHIIKPVTDIQDRAVEYNRQNLPKDPLLRSGAEPVYDGVYDAVRSMSEGVRREAPWLASGAMERSRPKTLAITNMDQIVPRYHDTFQPSDRLVMPAGNPLVRVRDAGEAIVHRTKQFIDSFADRGNKLITDAKSLAPARQDVVSKLINDATMANVHLAGDNPHLTTPDQLAAEAALKARYHALSPEEQRVEQAFPKIHGDMDETQRQAQLEGILANVFPETTEGQRTEWGRITSSKDRLDAFEANPDTSALAREYGPAWADKYADLAKVSAKVINAGWQRGDFVPLRRHGDFGIAYGERGTPSEGFERFDTRGQAEERHAQLVRENTPNLRNVDLVDKHAVRELTLGNPLIEQLNRALERRPDLAEHADDIRDMMNKLVLEGMARSDGSRMHRRNIQGASLDFTRTLAKELQDTAVRTGYYAHGGERFRAVADMRRIADDLGAHGDPGQSREARQVIAEIEKHVTSQENTGGATAAIARRAGTFGYMQSLSSLSHLITSTIENYSMAYPQIAARHGYGATAIELGRVGKSLILPMLKTGGANTMRALRNTLREKDWNVADVIADHLRQSGFNGNHVTSVFNMLKRTGLIDHSYARELKRLANPEGLLSRTGRVVDYFNNLMGVWSHSVDAMNRANVAMTSFNLEFRKTGDAGKALAYAEIRAREASPNYNLVNKNRFSTSAGPLGGAAGPITQFKQYGFFSYGILGNAVKQSLAKMPSEMRTEARYALAGMLATHALTAGAFTLIADPLRYIMGMYDWMTGATKPHDYQADLRGYLDRAVGPELGQFIARGAIDTFLGASTHRRVGFANVLEIPPLESYDLAGVLKMIGTAVVGASGEDATKFATGLQAMGQGHIYDGIKSMIPRPIRDAMTAHELATQGVKTQAGRTLLPPEKITPWDVGLQAFGFQPSRVSEAREASAAIQQRRDEAKEGHTKLIRQWVANPENHASIMDQVTKFNLDPNNQSAKVTMKELHNAEKEARKLARHPEAYGLRLPKKGQQNLIEAGSFANI